MREIREQPAWGKLRAARELGSSALRFREISAMFEK
jgi:hypothetical protein